MQGLQRNIEDAHIAIIGLGYVGLPLAVEFAKRYRVIGFDINQERIGALRNAVDQTMELSPDELKGVLVPDVASSTGLLLSGDPESIVAADVYIITVPTPIDKYKRPDLTPLLEATRIVGNVLRAGDLVIYESTVYPGLTEEECVPVLENMSGLIFNEQFHVGYSSERINPGDRLHRLPDIKKVTSGSTPEAALWVDALYASVIKAGTYLAPSIKVAEAAKVIENAQRDINIAFVNELAKIFQLMDIDTHEVLKAAGTKWNFLSFWPGLVGGHCIGVDPYYLTQKAQAVGYHPDIILAGRRVNDSMGEYIVDQVIKKMAKKRIDINKAKVLVLGFTFKENCTDVRNTKVIDIVRELGAYNVSVAVYDPRASAAEVKKEYGLDLAAKMPVDEKFDAVILAVAHNEFLQMDITKMCCDNCVLFDVKSVLPKEAGAYRL